MAEEKSPEQIKAEKDAEMQMYVDRIKRLALPCAIVNWQIKLKYGWGDVFRKNAKAFLEQVEQDSDDDLKKPEQMETARELVKSGERWEEETKLTFDFLLDVQAGKLPQDWLEMPDWNSDGYPYEGILRHNTARGNAVMEITLTKSGIEPSEATTEQIEKAAMDVAIYSDRFLQEKAKTGEIEGYDLASNPLIEK